ncbi:MAG: nitronate monooxygenase [Deltaproteobacteria bacterium]|nr:nitronate monooxygenase [Deltaproteobacteria bacterium]
MFVGPLKLRAPVIQAPMGAGISRHELAAAVSEAGGLGTIAVNGAGAIERELAAARRLTGAPVAVGVLLPFLRRSWLPAIAKADAVVSFWGRPRRLSPGYWMHQSGSVEEAAAAHAAGADAVIVQGVEAGGHVRGTTPALELLAQARATLPIGYPLVLAGGIAERGDVARALDAGASAVMVGTRFLLSDESRAHPLYVQRLLRATRTLRTELFGFGWPAAPHRVIANAATERGLRADGSVPPLTRALHRLSGLTSRYVPDSVRDRLVRRQHAGSRMLSPITATDDRGENLIDGGALYAGETVARITDVRPAAELVAALSP